MPRTLPHLAVVTLLASSCSAALAHDIVVFPERDGDAISVRVRYGHPDDWQPIAKEKLYAFAAYGADGDDRSWRKRLVLDGMDLKAGERSGTAGATLFAAQYDNGYWSKDADGESVNTSRRQNPRAAAGSHNLKYAKALVAGGADHAGFDRVVGHKLELVPRRDPLAAKPGDTLPVAVFFNGKPLPGAAVEIGDSITALPEEKIARYKADANGVARIPIAKGGWAVIGIDHEERSPTPALATLEKYTATFTFRVP